MAENHYNADSAFMPSSRVVFAVHPDLMANPVFIFEHGFVPARETFPIIPSID